MSSTRSKLRSFRHLLASSVVALSAAACSGKDPYSPGTKLGTFHVTATLKSTSCGATPNPWEFDVRLNHDGPTLFWIQGGVPIEGRVDETARTQLRASIVEEVRPADAKAQRDACSIARTDTLALTLAAADAAPTNDPSLATSFAGSLIYTFAPTRGSDCSDQVTSAGGDFDSLPCEVHYDLTGTFTSPPR